MAGQCTVQLLGGFRVEVEGRLVPDRAWRHRRGADLVKLLALAQPHRIHREQVEDTLWPDLSREAAAANLRKAIYFARRALGREDAIELGAGMVALWPHGELVVDSERFEAAARVARAPGDGSAAAAALFGGDLLPEDRYAEWTEPHRERLRQRYVELLKRTGQWEQILEMDRSDEQAHQALMRQAIERGDRRAAIRQFARLREVLRVDLGVGPSAETVALFEQAIGMEGAETPAPEDRVRALIARALVSWSEQDLRKAELDAEQARQLADDYELGRELGEASTVLGLVAWARGNWRDRFRTESMDVFRRTPDQAVSVFEGQLCLAEAALYSAESEAVGALARELLTTAESTGSICGQALMNLLIGETDLFSGRLAEARVRLSQAIELCRGLGSSTGQGFALVRLAELASTSGRLDEARQLVTTAMRLAGQSELGDHLLVRAYAELIRATAGRRRRMRIVEEAVHAYQNRRMCGPCSIGFWLVAATASIGAGDLARARTYLREAERQAGMWQGGPWLAATWEARAALRLAEGERVQAAALLREAEGLYAQSARPVDAARCRAAALAVGRQTIAIS